MGIQDPTEAFVDGKLPPTLDELANPRPKPESVEASQARKPLVTVAVIDNGVDYLHPFLRDKIRYEMKDGIAVGAGKDFLGNDDFAHPNMIVTAPFAFGAKLSSDGRIETMLPDPIAALTELNNDFMEKLEGDLKTAPELQGTFFARFDRNSFHLLGAQLLIENEAELESEYEQTKALGMLIDPTSRETGSEALKKELSIAPEGIQRARFEAPWGLGYGSFGLPAVPKEELYEQSTAMNAARPLAHLRGFDAFMKILKARITEFNGRTQYLNRYFQPYFEYRDRELPDEQRGKSHADLIELFAEELYKSWFTIRMNYLQFDPLAGTVSIFCKLLTPEQLAKVNSSSTNSDERKQILFGLVDQVFAEAEKLEQLAIDDPEVTLDEKLSTRWRLRSGAKYRAFAKAMLEDRDPDLFRCERGYLAKTEYKYKDFYQDYARRTENPYLREESTSQSHGTHVSGIILSQEPRAQILPIRVITQERLTNPEIDAKMQKQFLLDLRAWAALPNIKRAFEARIAKYSDDPSKIDLDSAFKMIADDLPHFYEKHKLDFFFFDQLRAALKYTAEQKVKIANISLGVSYDKPAFNPNQEQQIKLEDDLHFLAYEYFKYRLGEVLVGEARDTLFVVAAGNDGFWLDGRSKAGLPCDISSPFLEDFRRPGEPVPPNNRIHNILCVASLDPKNELSSYTNILTTSKIPFVASYGEAIDSSVKTEDCLGVGQEINAKLSNAEPQISYYNNSVERYLWSADSPQRNGQRTADDIYHFRKTKAQLELDEAFLFDLTMPNGVAAKHACVAGRYVAHGRMSGTSMATPGVAGQVARVYAAELAHKGLSEANAYINARFSPERLIRDLMKYGSSYPEKDSRIGNLRMIIKNRPYSGSGQKPEVIPVSLGDQIPAIMRLP